MIQNTGESLDFLSNGFTQKQKESSRKSKSATAMPWDGFLSHLRSEIKSNSGKYVRKTVFMERENP